MSMANLRNLYRKPKRLPPDRVMEPHKPTFWQGHLQLMPYLTPVEITKLIAERRIALGLSYADAAKKCGMTRGNWCNVEKNNRSTSAETLSRMANVVGLKVDPQEVLRVHEDAPKKSTAKKLHSRRMRGERESK